MNAELPAAARYHTLQQFNKGEEIEGEQERRKMIEKCERDNERREESKRISGQFFISSAVMNAELPATARYHTLQQFN